MCGITGFTHLNSPANPDRIHQAVQTLIHRGPDQQNAYASGVVSLGATRLKIIDLETGAQPMTSADGDTVVAFNGEIYNHEELRRELELRGHRFRSRCDTETLLAAFLEWDTACLARLRGMFAVALWSESKRRLVLARDRMGIKPLYIARHRGELYFGSELKSIFVHPEIERRLSLEGLDCYLSLNYVPCPWTLVEGIEKLPPGSWLEWRDGRTKTQTYWNLPTRAEPHWTLQSAEMELDALMRRSVREHLLSDVPLGIWLSGGVDSTTLLHYAAHASGRRLKTFSITFRGRRFDEAAYIHEAAKHYGAEHEEFDLNPEANLAGAVEEFAYYFDEPCADAGALPVWFLSKLTRQSVTVALSGEGADELFGGYLTYRADALAARARRWPPFLLRAASAMVARWPVSNEKIGLEYKVKRFLAGCQMAPEWAHIYWNGAFSSAEKRALLSQATPAAMDRLLAAMPGGTDGLAPYLWFDQRYYLPDDILLKVDRMSMAHSLEVRPPFLDHRIVEFAASLPSELKVNGARQKIALKHLMRAKLPASILRRKKEGFDIPAHEWMRGPLRALMLESVANGLAAYPDLFRASAVNAYIERHLDRRANVGYHLWGLMLLFLWMKRWQIQAAPAPAHGELANPVATSI